MQFRNWLESGGAATSLMHGGIYGLPFKTTNDNMPVRSKYTVSSGVPKNDLNLQKDGEPTTVDQQWKGKKRTLSKQPSERKAAWIDKIKKVAPTRNDRPDIVY